MADTVVVQTGVPVTTAAPTIPDNVKATDTGAVVTTDSSLRPAAPTERPSWHLPNFKTVEDQAKSYAEAQKELTKTKQELAELRKGSAASSAATVATTTSATTADASAAASASQASSPAASTASPVPPSKLDLQALSAEWAANGGKLTDASLSTLAKAGISREAVDSYIAGQQALADKRGEDLARAVGGADRLRSVLDFYASGVGPKEEATAYNKALSEGRVDDARIILTAMNNRYTDRVGRDPRVLVKGELSSGVAENEKPFSSIQEASRAMADPRYKTDPMYRRSVERRTMAIGR